MASPSKDTTCDAPSPATANPSTAPAKPSPALLPFGPLRKLPLELRQMVYDYIMEGTKEQGLTGLDVPGLALMPNEFARYFFDKTHITIVTGTTVNVSNFTMSAEAFKKGAGTLGVMPKVRRPLSKKDKLGWRPLFRNVTIVIVPSDEVKKSRQSKLVADAYVVGKLHIKVTDNVVDLGEIDFPPLQMLGQCIAFSNAIQQIRTMEKRKNFAGFTMDDLDAIVKEFRKE